MPTKVTSSVRFEPLPQPTVRLPIVNNPTLLLQEEHLVAAVPYSGTGCDGRLHLIDVETMTEQIYPLPAGERGAYGFTCGSDGRLYLGTFSGRVLAFNVKERIFQEIARPFRHGQMVWGGGTSSLGRIYMGVYPTGEFCEYNICNGSLKVFNPVPQRGKLSLYARQFIELPDKRILVVIWGAENCLLFFDPLTGKWNQYQPPRCNSASAPARHSLSFQCFYDDDLLVSNDLQLFSWKTMECQGQLCRLPRGEITVENLVKVGNFFYGVGYPSGYIYVITQGRARAVKKDIPEGNRPKIHCLDGDAEWVAIGENGLCIRFNLKTKVSSSLQMRNESRNGMDIMMLMKVPGKKIIVGSHYISMQLFCINLKNRSVLSSLHKIASYSGQVTCATYLNGIVYLASYCQAVIHAYNPEQAFEYGRNPHVVGIIGKKQNRPIAMANDGRYVYVATRSDYQTLGGAIAIFDPATGNIDVYRHFVRNHNPTSMFYYPALKCLVGTTQIYGDVKTCAPRAKRAVVYVWDTVRRKIVYTAHAGEIDAITGYDLSPGGKLLGISGEFKYFLFDLSTGKFKVRPWPVKDPDDWIRGGLFMNRRHFYGAVKNHLFRLDIRTQELLLLAEVQAAGPFTKISETEFLFVKRPATIIKACIRNKGK